ncbi:MAG: hypothetical protein ACYDCN_00740 [Bacteroidia bacterium]
MDKNKMSKLISDTDIEKELNAIGLNPYENPFIEKETYLVRINLKIIKENERNVARKDLPDNQKEIDNHFKNNLVSINIRDYETEDKQYFEDFKNGKPNYKGSKYISDFYMLCEDVKKDNVLVFATYPGHKESQLGIIRKGTTHYSKRTDDENYHGVYYGFELIEVKILENSENTMLLSAVPYYSTISHIVKHKEWFNYKYNRMQLPLELKHLIPTHKLIELMCLEWLRSDYCPKEWKIKYQLLLVGKNNAKIDIYGKTINDKTIACQVTTTDEKKLIEKKGKELKEVKSDFYILFHNGKKQNREEILLQEVWDDFEKDSEYKAMLETMIRG